MPREHFVDETLRDVCILETTEEDWRHFLDALESGPWPVQRRIGMLVTDAWPTADEALAKTPDGSDEWWIAVEVAKGWLSCNFFRIDEIELNLDPELFLDQAPRNELLRFLRWTAAAVGKPVILTMEGIEHDDNFPLARVSVDGTLEN